MYVPIPCAGELRPPSASEAWYAAGAVPKRRRSGKKFFAAIRAQCRFLFAFVWRRLMFRTTVIAITGSVGKTTAKECLAAILAAHGQTEKTRNNQNDEAGVARTVRAFRPWHRFAVVEVAGGKLGHVRRASRLLKPDLVIVLSVARTHTDVFRTLDDTAREKAQLLTHLKRGGIALLNGDDERVRPMAVNCRGKVVWFGQGRDCNIVAADVRAIWPARLQFTARSGSDCQQVRTQLVGTHWAVSALAALAAAQACGIPLAAAAARLSLVSPAAGRMQPVNLPCGAVAIRDEENGSPDTLEAMLKVLREAECGRKILVFSDVSDSSAKPRRRLRDMGRLAAEFVQLAVFVGEHSHHAVRGAVDAGMDPAHCHSVIRVAQAADWLRQEARAGDLIFVKGRATDHLSRIVFSQFGQIGCWQSRCRIQPVCDLCAKLMPSFDLPQALAVPAPPG